MSYAQLFGSIALGVAAIGLLAVVIARRWPVARAGSLQLFLDAMLLMFLGAVLGSGVRLLDVPENVKLAAAVASVVLMLMGTSRLLFGFVRRSRSE